MFCAHRLFTPPLHVPPLYVFRRCILQPLSNNQTSVFLLGQWQGLWQLTQVPLPLPSTPIPLRDTLGPRIPECPCLALGDLTFNGAHYFMALERASGLVLVRGTVEGWGVALSVPVEGVAGGAMVNALVLDPVLEALFVAFNLPDEPSQLYKVNAGTLVVYGIKKMRNRGGPPPPPARVPFCVCPALSLYVLHVDPWLPVYCRKSLLRAPGTPLITPLMPLAHPLHAPCVLLARPCVPLVWPCVQGPGKNETVGGGGLGTPFPTPAPRERGSRGRPLLDDEKLGTHLFYASFVHCMGQILINMMNSATQGSLLH